MKSIRLLGALLVGLGVSLVLVSALAPLAWAAPTSYFVKPDGTGTTCSQAAPCNLPTAMTQASTGDTVYVATGVYTGTAVDVIQVSKSITLTGGWDGAAGGPVVRDPTAYPTTLDGEDARRVIYISGAITPTVEGFIVTRGRRTEAAGIAVYAGANVTLRDNLIISNTATGGWGGGILVENSVALIEHNRIISNSTPYEGGGLASAFGARLTLFNNLIAGNSADVHGAGIRLRDVEAVLLNNTIARNGGVDDEAIYASTQDIAITTTLALVDNLIVSSGYGLRLADDGGQGITYTLRHNDVWGHSVQNYDGLADPTGSDGNLSLDPLFVSAWGESYFLSQPAAGQAATSPAVDAGSDTVVNLGLDTRTTRSDGVADSGTVDLGYHYYLSLRRLYLPLAMKNH